MTVHHFHAVVWLDHSEARVFSFNQDEVEKLVIHPDKPHRHLHHKAGSVSGSRSKEDVAFFQDIVEGMTGAGAILVCGPASAKTEFVKWLAKAHADVLELVAAVETVDHPTDGALVAHARKYFKVHDKMTPQR